ncbi:MAG: hypothetical protein LBS63_02240 [Prevotellaceae bacterium]|jgi:hypothetical protein|nr:hypothetical protein [Prevotellaceae bacterium]
MKRFFVVAAAALMAASTFVACSDDKKEEEGGAPDSLVGTTWRFSEKSEEDNQVYYTIYDFTTSTVGAMKQGVEGGTDEQSESITYSYTKPNVTITVDEFPDSHATGVVSGNKMTLTHRYGDGADDVEVAVFVKQ